MKKLLTTLSILLIATTSYAKTYTVERVIDGDTIKLTNGLKVNLMGLDAPESKSNKKARRDSNRTGQDVGAIIEMGQEATAFVKSIVKEGQAVRLEFDIKDRNKRGQLLPYLFLDEDKPAGWHLLAKYPKGFQYVEFGASEKIYRNQIPKPLNNQYN